LDAHLKALREADAAAFAAADTNVAKPGKKGKAQTSSETKDSEGGKKRKTASHGVEKLKKVNTTGMKKISSFFGGKG
jgi:ribonuclease H2 subunit B